jgi:hypothetical protein
VAIAMNPVSGKGAVQVSSISSNIITSLLYGEALDLERFFKEVAQSEGVGSILTIGDVDKYEHALITLGIDGESEVGDGNAITIERFACGIDLTLILAGNSHVIVPGIALQSH